MKSFVLDCSITMSWCFEDEKTTKGDAILDSLIKEEHQALVPSLWSLEVVNVLICGERRGRITAAKVGVFLDFLAELPIHVDESQKDPHSLFFLSRTYGLSAYDAMYLSLALQEQIPLATLDKKLNAAAKLAGVSLVKPKA